MREFVIVAVLVIIVICTLPIYFKIKYKNDKKLVKLDFFYFNRDKSRIKERIQRLKNECRRWK